MIGCGMRSMKSSLFFKPFVAVSLGESRDGIDSRMQGTFALLPSHAGIR
jgi:hypothetical protein